MEVRWTTRSVTDFENTVLYLEKEWGQKVSLEFIERIDKIIRLIQQYPKLYPTSTKIGAVRRCVISKHTSLSYRINQDQIEILALFDNRANESN